MPFYLHISEPSERVKNRDEIDRSGIANERIVGAMRNLLQLIEIADDIFVAIESECRSVYERTTKLNLKIQRCQHIVDNLNAKEVTVPRGSLSENPTDYPPFKCSRAQVSNFSSLPRPLVVEKLRNSADGPSPPVIIPSGMVASQVEGVNRTHIYCTAVKIKDAGKPRNILASRKSNASKKTMSSSSKMPSNVVAIDVSGQPFSRMASFRRSLIHVDFLIRRKQKKDKRRNTVAEGDVKDLKDTLEKIVNEDCQFTLPNSICSYQQILASSKNQINERNNNKSIKKHGCMISTEILNEKSSNNLSNSESNLDETENHVSSKRKPKSHIPISTLSAAMNVAVEMRQSNAVRSDTTVLNGISNNTDQNCSVSDSRRKDNHDDESWASYKKRLQDKCKSLTSNSKDLNGKEVEVSSTASSENIDPQDSLTTMATSTESDTFFISSDESDEEYSDVAGFQENYGSSTSLGTASDGSLNSLLSENGTEMTSSTGTLTSVGQEHLLTTPPPPPPMILSATLKNKDLIDKVPDTENLGVDNSTLKSKNNTKVANGVPKKAKKIKSPKSSKPLKSDFRDLHRNLTENSKNIFTSLVSLKDKNKSKCKDVGKKKSSKNSHQPAFDMYGNSPTNEKQIATFIKENISPIQTEEKSDMKSFFVKDRQYQFSNNEMMNKFNSAFGTDKNICSSDNVSCSESKRNQTVNSIPPKYEHQVTVKPIQRPKDKILPDKSPAERESVSRQSCWSTENQIYAPRVLRPNPPVTLERSKAARVVLDYNGRVIYSTNSLDRKHYSLGANVNMYNSVQSATCDMHWNDMELKSYSCQENHRQPVSQVNYSSYTTPHGEKAATFSPVPWQILTNLRPNESYHVKQAYEFAGDIPSSQWQSRRSENMDVLVSKRMDVGRPYFYERNSPEDSPNIIRDPNISGLPVQETALTKRNVSLHSKQMEQESENIYPRHSNVFCLSPSSKDGGNGLNKSPQSTMSTEDLFAVIHNCKKRMNIKTDPDITSSRSSSPSYIRPSSSKSILAETGFLSPRSQVQLETSRDRKSWSDFRPVDSIYSERKCLASDRLGPTKPTSMHDFKMLLLQARTSSQISGPRKSAVEMLKVPSTPNNKNTIPPLLSPRNSISMSVPNSPSAELSIYNGHSTVPFKRGNRVRASLQPRYIMYPPIFEDCSEDSENNNLEKERLE